MTREEFDRRFRELERRAREESGAAWSDDAWELLRALLLMARAAAIPELPFSAAEADAVGRLAQLAEAKSLPEIEAYLGSASIPPAMKRAFFSGVPQIFGAIAPAATTVATKSTSDRAPTMAARPWTRFEAAPKLTAHRERLR
jgi:hypothetical protein